MPANTKRFETWELRRLPVVVTPEAKTWLDASNREGRILGQALSEAFGTRKSVKEVQIALAEKTDRFSETPYTDEQLLVISVHHHYTNVEDYHWLINCWDVMYLDERTGLYPFQSRHLASELVRQHMHLVVEEDEGK